MDSLNGPARRSSTRARFVGLILRPWRDLLDGLDGLVAHGGSRALISVFAGLLAGWWFYVPVHELSHAATCWLAGGEVSRLEIDPWYGGAILARWFPWVVSGSEYAGRLTGFDTHGSDLRYLATDLGPFIWGLVALPVLLIAARRRFGFVWGFALPWAFAPFLSLTGDAYEIGSIVVTRASPWSNLATVIRGDDLLKTWSRAQDSGATAIVGWLLASVLGVIWAFGWYLSTRWIAGRVVGRSG